MIDQNQTKISVLIPARSGSKRVPDKNIRILDGLPLLVHSILLAKQLSFVQNVIVSTNCQNYAKISEQYGAEVLMRPEELSGDNVGDFPVISHFLSCYPADYVVYLRPTTPFRSIGLVEQAVQTILDAGEDATSLRSVEEMTENVEKCFYINRGYLNPVIGDMDRANRPNHECTPSYRGNGYVDIVKETQVRDGDLWGNRCIGFVTPPVIEIDTERDFWLAEQWLKRERRL
jgi:N-acylneuraminate cytidylyltransferase